MNRLLTLYMEIIILKTCFWSMYSTIYLALMCEEIICSLEREMRRNWTILTSVHFIKTAICNSKLPVSIHIHI